jgi:tetratricopeptide (TPR) repeat protein
MHFAVCLAILSIYMCTLTCAADTSQLATAIEKAKSYASKLNGNKSGQVLLTLTEALANSGDFGGAESLAEEIADPLYRQKAYETIGYAQSKQGKLDEDIIQIIRRGGGDEALLHMADVQSAMGNYQKAIALIDRVDAKSAWKSSLVMSLLRAKDIQSAERIAKGPSGGGNKFDDAQSYLVIAEYLIHEKRLPEASEWCNRAFVNAKSHWEENVYDENQRSILRRLERVAEAYRDVGDKVAASSTLWKMYGIGSDYTVFQETIDTQARLDLYHPGEDRGRLISLANAVSGGWNEEALGLLTDKLAEMGDLDGAMDIFKDVPGKNRGSLWGEQDVATASEGIVGALVKAGKIDEAVQIMKRVRPNPVLVEFYISNMCEIIMTRLVEFNMVEKAYKIASDMEDPSVRAVAQSKLVYTLVKADKVDDAVRIAVHIEVGSSPISVMRGGLELIRQETATGDVKGVKSAIDMNELSKMVNGRDFYHKGEALQAIAGQFAEKKMWAEARVTALGIEDPLERDEALENLANKLSHDGLFRDAMEIADMLKGSEKVGDFRFRILSGIAHDQAEKKMWADARETAMGIEDSLDFRVKVLCAIAHDQAAAGRMSEAMRLVDSTENVEGKAWILTEVVKGTLHQD